VGVVQGLGVAVDLERRLRWGTDLSGRVSSAGPFCRLVIKRVSMSDCSGVRRLK
jgi:hypothetical protein